MFELMRTQRGRADFFQNQAAWRSVEGDRKSKNGDSNDTCSKENKAVDYCLPRAQGLLGHGPRQLA